MTKSENSFRIIKQNYFAVLPVQIASGLVLYLHSLLDSVFVGQFLGEANLAVIGLASPFTLVLSVIGYILATGGQLLCGNAMGRGDPDGVSGSFGNVVAMSLGFGAVTTALCFSLSGWIPGWLGVEDAATAAAFTDYLRGICIGFTFAIFFQPQQAFLELDRAGHFALLSTVVMILTKIGFDLLSIFTVQNGMFGIGLATSLSNIAAVLVGLICFVFRCKSFRFRFRCLSGKTSLALLVKGFPGGLQTLSVLFNTMVLNALVMKHGGQTGVSILTVAMNVTEFLFCAICAAFTTAAVLISVYAGSRDRTSVKSVCVLAIHTGWVLAVISFVLLILLGKPLALLFGLNAEAADVAALAMPLLISAGFVCWGKVLHLSVYKSLGMVRRASVCCVVAFCGIPCITQLVMSSIFGLTGIWWGYLVQDTISLLAFFVIDAVKLKRIPWKMREWVYLPPSFGAAHEERLDLSLRSLEDVSHVSESVSAFCREKGIDARRGNFAGLCVEEMASNVFRHNGVSRKLSADLRVTVEGGELYLSLRDNGRAFNPEEYLALTHGEDRAANVGLRLVAGLAKEIRYASPLGCNLLTIRM